MVDTLVLTNYSFGLVAYLSYVIFLKYIFFDLYFIIKVRALLIPFLYYTLSKNFTIFTNGDLYLRDQLVDSLLFVCRFMHLVANIYPKTFKSNREAPLILKPGVFVFLDPTRQSYKLDRNASRSFKTTYLTS